MFPKQKVTVVMKSHHGSDFAGQWRAPRLEQKVRHVCRPCNTGWMSTLENESKDILSPMIRGEDTRLSASDQRQVAIWAAKTAVVFERIYPHKRASALPQAFARTIRDKRACPENTLVRAAAYDAVNCLSWHQHHVLDLSPAFTTGDRINGYDSTLAVGHLVLQVFWSGLTTQVASRPEWDRFIFRLWPTMQDEITWPPSSTLDFRGLESFTNILLWKQAPTTPPRDHG
jgi:hypothetical protein